MPQPPASAALIACPACRRAIPTDAPVCPRCGQNLRSALAELVARRRRRRRAVRRFTLILVMATAATLLTALATRHERDRIPSTPPPPPPAVGVAVPAAPAAAVAAPPPAAMPAAAAAAATTAPVGVPSASAPPAEDAAGDMAVGDGPQQPAQPTTGPGSSWCTSQAVRQSSYGEGDTQYWLFEPAAPAPATAPVVIFLHGWSAMLPEAYLSWIEHLVRRGSIVIYPRYQAALRSSPDGFTDHTIVALTAAVAELARPGLHVQPDLAHLTCVGHSFGAVIAANLASRSGLDGLPPLRAVMCVEPGAARTSVTDDYARIPAGTLLLCIAGADDHIAGQALAQRICREATTVPAADKDFILLRSDHHGTPALEANHFAPAQRGGCGCWYGFWKWFDALQTTVLSAQDRDAALGNTPRQRSLGVWSDGQAITEPLITAAP